MKQLTKLLRASNPVHNRIHTNKYFLPNANISQYFKPNIYQLHINEVVNVSPVMDIQGYLGMSGMCGEGGVG